MVDFQSREPRTRTDDADENEDEAATESKSESSEIDDSPEAETERAETPPQADSSISYAIVTITGKRSVSEDTQGDTVVEILEDSGAVVSTRDLINSSFDGVQSTVATLAERGDVDVIITIGGTGIEPSDVSIEALEPLFDKKLPGFGELFRRLTYDDHGTAVIGTRTTAGVVAGVPVFALPGTVDGVVRGAEEIIVPEAESLVRATRSV